MKSIRHFGLAAITAALLTACGGGDEAPPAGSGAPSGAPTTAGTFSAVVSFGDSLSDVGAYAPATSLSGNGQAPYFGGKFTTNSATGTVWVENLATALGLRVTPAEVGFNGASVRCPAAGISAALAGTCTGYGQGGSRITNPAGIGRAANGSGALTVPVVTQIANHLTRFTTFRASDLVFVYGGNNDVFSQFGIFSAKVGPIQARAAAGTITPGQANIELLEAQVAGQLALKQAAVELAGYVKTEILAKGAVYVAVVNLPDSALTPFGASLPATARPVLTGFVDTFNAELRNALDRVPVQLVDANAQIKDVGANPARYGFTNTTVPACDAARISAISGGLVTDGSSLFCNSTTGAPFNGLRTGADVNTWLFADGVHPTTGGHRAFSDFMLARLRAFGWIP